MLDLTLLSWMVLFCFSFEKLKTPMLPKFSHLPLQSPTFLFLLFERITLPGKLRLKHKLSHRPSPNLVAGAKLMSLAPSVENALKTVLL